MNITDVRVRKMTKEENEIKIINERNFRYSL